MNKLEIGNLVQKRRVNLSLTQEDLAEIANVSSKSIYSLEQGKGNSTLDMLLKILQILGLELNVEIKKIDE